DTRNGHRMFGVCDDKHVLVQGALHAVKGDDRFAGLSPPYNDLWSFDQGEVKSMQRLASLKHHKVGDVDDVIDRTHAGSTQVPLHPPRRRPDRDVLDHKGTI